MTPGSPPVATSASTPTCAWSPPNLKGAGMPRSNVCVNWRARLAAFDARPDQQSIDTRALQALAQDLPAVWHDPSTDRRLKQRIVRILVHEIIVDVDDEAQTIVLVMHWQGGRHTEVRVPRPSSGRTTRCTDAEAIALVRRMAGRWNDDAIAAQLNLVGWRTGTGNHWTRLRVRELRSRLDLPACDPTQPAWLTAKAAAKHLDISPVVRRPAPQARHHSRHASSPRQHLVGRSRRPRLDGSARDAPRAERAAPGKTASRRSNPPNSGGVA